MNKPTYNDIFEATKLVENFPFVKKCRKRRKKFLISAAKCGLLLEEAIREMIGELKETFDACDDFRGLLLEDEASFRVLLTKLSKISSWCKSASYELEKYVDGRGGVYPHYHYRLKPTVKEEN